MTSQSYEVCFKFAAAAGSIGVLGCISFIAWDMFEEASYYRVRRLDGPNEKRG